MLFFQFTKIILKTDEEIWCKLCIFKWRGGDIAIVNYLIAYIKEGTLLQYNSLTFKVLDEWYSLSSFGQINFYPCIELG